MILAENRLILFLGLVNTVLIVIVTDIRGQLRQGLHCTLLILKR